ncbi:MAG: PxKF domain-containing protein [Gemmatimonadaceae bacterium]
MRPFLRQTLLLPTLALAAACSLDTTSPASPNDLRSGDATLAMGGGGCFYVATTSGILQPINADHSSVFKLGRTIPVKIRVVDCATQEELNTLQPQVSLASVDAEGGAMVNALESSSAADDGTTMRSAGNGQYIFNLSTKNSQFGAGSDLVAGTYELTISSWEFEPVVVRFALRP